MSPPRLRTIAGRLLAAWLAVLIPLQATMCLLDRLVGPAHVHVVEVEVAARASAHSHSQSHAQSHEASDAHALAHAHGERHSHAASRDDVKYKNVAASASDHRRGAGELRMPGGFDLMPVVTLAQTLASHTHVAFAQPTRRIAQHAQLPPDRPPRSTHA